MRSADWEAPAFPAKGEHGNAPPAERALMPAPRARLPRRKYTARCPSNCRWWLYQCRGAECVMFRSALAGRAPMLVRFQTGRMPCSSG